ncbi:unnamed protein product [Porites evermanni]|uniref:Uncharacterized protein n=1 Tax=Porites evermanni TaxID=104178 RepID=A0ABN8LL84_9CNID|nr:unnamed protein product [Porites evermanni]
MTSSTDLEKRSDLLKSHISDHYLVYAFLKLKISKPPPSYVEVRSYKNYDSQFFVSDLERVPWNEVVVVDDTSDMVDRFNKRFLEVLDGHAPVKSVKEATQQVYTREVKAVTEKFNEFFVCVGAKASEASKALIATHELSPPNDFTSGIYSG